jgi:hypothetical protein
MTNVWTTDLWHEAKRDSSALLCVGVLFPQTFELLLTNENYVKFPKKVQSTAEDLFSLPNQSHKSKTHLSEMSL